MSDEYSENSEVDHESTESKKERDQEIIEEAKAFFKYSSEQYQDILEKANQDDKFAAGEQWDPILLKSRQDENRPALTINKVIAPIRQVSNEGRKNRPALKVYPVGDGAKEETAKVRQGMIRNIEYESDAQIAYSVALECAARKSLGYFRIGTDYESWDSMNLVIKILAVHNPLSVRFDPASVEPDGKDASKAIVFDDISKDEFKTLYPDAETNSYEDFQQQFEDSWVDKEKVRVAEYYTKKFEEVTIYEVTDPQGQVSTMEESLIPEGYTKGKSRKSLKAKIMHYKIGGCDLLEETEVIGSYIPVIPMYGARAFVNGKWIIESVHRHSQDAQRLYNFSVSNEAEALSLVPRAPYIVEKGQVPLEYQHIWNTANTKSWPMLPYDKVEGAPPPQRNVIEPATSALINSKLHASDDIKATTGIYDDSLGRNTQNKSGIALQRTQQQSQTSNFHFMDNQAISIKHGGRIINEWLDKIYDTARQIRIVGEDGSQEMVQINQPFQQGNEIVHHDLKVGKYDVVLDVGPSYETKRQESADMLLEFSKSFPQQAPAFSDLIAKNMDFPDAPLLAERLRKVNGVDDDKNKAIPPQAQQQIQQLSQMVEQLTETSKKQHDIITNKTNELESKERIEFAKMQNQLAIESLKAQNSESLALFHADIKMIQTQLGALDIGQPIDEEFNESGNQAAIQQGQM